MKNTLSQTWSEIRFSNAKKLPVVLQATATECGLSCIAMILIYYGHKTDLNLLRRRFSISSKGITLDRLIKVANEVNLSARPLQTSLNELKQLQTPCILHWNFNHFVVLKKANSHKIIIHDPASGLREYNFTDASKYYTGIALELTPTSNFIRQEKTERVRLSEMTGEISGLFSSFSKIFILATVAQLFMLMSPLFMQWVIDGALVSADKTFLTGIALGFLMLSVIQAAITAVRSWAVLYLTTQIKLQWAINVFSHLIKLPVLYFEQRQLGDISSRFNSIEVIQRVLTMAFIESFLDGILVIVVMITMLIYSPLLALIVLSAAIIYASIRFLIDGPLRLAMKEHIVFSAKRSSHLLETLRVIQSLKLFNREAERRSTWENLHVETLNRDIGVQKIHIYAKASNTLLFGIENVVTIWVGALLVLEGGFSVGMLFAFIAYRNQFSSRIARLIDLVMEVRALRLQGERLADIVYTEKEDDSGEYELITQNIQPTIEVRDVSFRYSEGEPWVLHHCSCKILTGQSIAITGASGCGKTTLLKILLGIHNPTEGEILIDGINIQRLGLHKYRQMLGTVMQDDQLLAGSIAENISFFSSKADIGAIESAAKMAAIHDDIIAMPMAYNTLVGEIGSTMSGGQRQRIMLARALYKQPKILLLDEATSHLDTNAEKVVNTSIKNLALTRIIIAHRQETINTTERIIELKNGKIYRDTYSTENTLSYLKHD